MNRRFEVLDAFRGLCALAVLVHHIRISGSLTEYSFFRNSDVFVEFFFVLSGFVLMHSYGFRKGTSFHEFITSRFFRIYPLHLFMLIIVIMIECGKLIAYYYGDFNFNNAPFSNRFALSELVPNLLLIQSWTNFSHNTSFNFPSWSISVEFYLYVIFFIFLSLLGKVRNILFLLIPIVIAVLEYISFDLFTSFARTGIICFFFGVSTYLFYSNIKSLDGKFTLSNKWGSFLEVLSVSIVIYHVSYGKTFSTFYLATLFSFVILVFSFESGYLSSIFKNKIFSTYGKLSYSMYMTHVAIIFIVTSFVMIIQKLFGLNLTYSVDGVRFLLVDNVILANLLLFMVIIATTLISNWTYRQVELRGQSLGRKVNLSLLLNYK